MSIVIPQRHFSARRSLLQILEWCVEALVESGQHRPLIQEATAAIARYRAVRSACGKAGKGKGGRPPRPLPWNEIDALRRRRKTWQDITDRLEAAEYRISRSTLIYRDRQRRKPVVTVTRGTTGK